ncbi:HNH endonuclease [Rothia nasimurium]|uniref:HNH endonuclease n=1 Tax=Rothia nasimurium TaxID=85336 RepID=UPI002351158D|nr:HNH endonuclease signature motif containing protein [Rothia nasimurium]
MSTCGVQPYHLSETDGRLQVPRKPATPCSHPGCPELSNDRFCPSHAQQDAQSYRRYQRDPKINRRYDHRWRKIRDRYIAAHPLCEQCQMDGRITPAQEVHHVLPLEHGGNHDESNLQALCKPCHSRQTARDGDRWRQGKLYTY